MPLSIHSQNVTLTPQLERHAQDKLDRLERYLPNIADVRLELSRNHTKRGEDITIAQITLRHNRGAILRAEEKLAGEDRDTIIKVINAASEKMYRQIERFKGKALKRKRRNGKISELYYPTDEELAGAEDVPNYEEIALEYADVEEDEIVRRKSVALSPLSEEEAIEQMELLGHKFFMFLNGKTGEVNVLYLRDTGGYGLLVPTQPS